MDRSVTPSVFHYENPRQFLLDCVSEIQKRDSSASIRTLARKMGMRSHTLLLMLLQGKRPLRVKHAGALAKGLDLSSAERLYLQALIQLDCAADPEEKQLCSLWLSELHPEKPFRTRELDEFELVSNWLPMAILALSETKDFSPEPEAIARRLGAKTNTAEVRSTIERLKSLGLIEMDSSGNFKPTYQRVSTRDDIANRGARKYHASVMDVAKTALDGVALDRREFQAFSISIPDAKVSLAKEMIRKFRSQFAKAMGQEPGDEIYQLNIQFFQLTESPVRMVRTEDEGVDAEWNSTSKGEYHA